MLSLIDRFGTKSNWHGCMINLSICTVYFSIMINFENQDKNVWLKAGGEWDVVKNSCTSKKTASFTMVQYVCLIELHRHTVRPETLVITHYKNRPLNFFNFWSCTSIWFIWVVMVSWINPCKCSGKFGLVV